MNRFSKNTLLYLVVIVLIVAIMQVICTTYVHYKDFYNRLNTLEQRVDSLEKDFNNVFD